MTPYWSMSYRECHLLFLVAVIFLTLNLHGCSNIPAEESKQEDAIAKEPNDQVEKQLRKQIALLNNKLAMLDLKLLEKQAEINQLEILHQNAIKEAVRAKAKLRSHSSKATAVANMVETKMTLKAIQSEELEAQQKKTLKQAEKLLQMSDLALDEGNIEGASFLSGKARQLILTVNIQENDQGVPKKKYNKIILLSPVSMKTVKRSNVRDVPGIEGKRVFQLNKNSLVRALAYSGTWVHIEDSSQRKGWIHYQLVKIIE